jgi:hypothetical protein
MPAVFVDFICIAGGALKQTSDASYISSALRS